MGEFIINRIKYYRNLLRITQKELAEGLSSSNYIYMLENGKKKLSMAMAVKLANRFNELSQEKGIILNITAKDLLRTSEEIIEEHYTEEFEDLKKGKYDFEKFKKLLDKVTENKVINLMIKINREIGENEYKENNCNLALKYFQNAFELMQSNSLQTETSIIKVEILNRIGTCHYKLFEYNLCIEYLKKAYKMYLDYNLYDDEVLGRILYNLALTVYDIENYDDAIMYLNSAIELKNISNVDKIKINILKANIYYKTKQKLESLMVYKEIEKYEKSYLVYYNMSIILRELGYKEESNEYIKKSMELQLDDSSEVTTNTLLQLSYMYRENKQYMESLRCLQKATINAKRFLQVDKYVECYEGIFQSLKGMNRLREFEDYVEDILYEIDIYHENYKILYRITLLLFQYTSEISKLDIGLDIIKKIKGRNISYEKC
ncbi:tetratricopeptide repeat protein [Clostridium senegalense]|uniref:tetratricopeptide repeat protein n=1 Tax=Clostridium senegalense TaxID=1465809 RepID=UPI001C0F9045|nr:tetratricopeptide repeat protein [Clostridium senegalense]MBU5225048.1 tetratricopeptide repeat protein [Clostridium senegalense]